MRKVRQSVKVNSRMVVKEITKANYAHMCPTRSVKQTRKTRGKRCGSEALKPWSTKNGAEDQSRTDDTRIFSPLLYHLSYLGIERQFAKSRVNSALLLADTPSGRTPSSRAIASSCMPSII